MKNPALFIVLFIIYACKNDCDLCFTPPDKIAFKIVEGTTGTNLLNTGFYIKDSIKLYCFNDTGKNDLTIQIVENSLAEKVIQADQLSWIAASGNNDFFLYLNHSDTDTIFLDVVKLSDKCCTWFKTRSFTVNNRYPEYNWDENVYLIEK